MKHLETSEILIQLEKIHTSIVKLYSNYISDKEETFESQLDEVIKEITSNSSESSIVAGIPTGFYDLDRVTRGWKKGDLIVLASRPGMAMNSFVNSLLLNAITNEDCSVSYFSMEYSAYQIIEMLLVARSGLEIDNIRKAKLNKDEQKLMLGEASINTGQNSLIQSAEKLMQSKIFLDDTQYSILELQAKCRKVVIEKGVQLIVINFLQLLSEHSKEDHNVFKSLTMTLKLMAKELDIPVILVSKLPKKVILFLHR